MGIVAEQPEGIARRGPKTKPLSPTGAVIVCAQKEMWDMDKMDEYEKHVCPYCGQMTTYDDYMDTTLHGGGMSVSDDLIRCAWCGSDNVSGDDDWVDCEGCGERTRVSTGTRIRVDVYGDMHDVE